MIQLTSTSDLLRVVTSGAAAYSVAVYAGWEDVFKARAASATWPPRGTVSDGRYNGVIISATTTTIVTSPASTAQRDVSLVSIRNTHASITVTVAVEHTDGSTAVTLWSGDLAAGESVGCGPDGVWVRYTSTGVRSGSGLTDLELRASAVPISAAALPLPSGASTEATLAAVDTKLGGTIAVSGTFWQATQPVSGTFWQATQPISATQLPAALVGGRLDVVLGAAVPAGTNNIGDVDILTVPAPLSTTGNGAAATALRVTMSNDSTGTVIATQATAANLNVTATPPTLTKGTQGATGYSTQDLKDSGRVLKTYTVSALACVTAEALISLTPYADLVASGAATTHAVTSGKRLRIQTIVVTVRATSTALVGGIIRFRMLAGAVLVGSPIHATLGACASEIAATIAGQCRAFMINFPDGLELSGSMQFGLTQQFSAVTATIDVQVVGYEY